MQVLMESRAAAWQADLSRPGGCLAFLPMTADMKVVFRSPQYPGLVVKMSTALSDLLNEVISMQHFHSFPKSDIWARVPWTGSPFALDCHGQPMFAFVQQRIAGALVKPRLGVERFARQSSVFSVSVMPELHSELHSVEAAQRYGDGCRKRLARLGRCGAKGGLDRGPPVYGEPNNW